MSGSDGRRVRNRRNLVIAGRSGEGPSAIRFADLRYRALPAGGLLGSRLPYPCGFASDSAGCRIGKYRRLSTSHVTTARRLPCRERVGRASCASHWCPVRSISRPRQHERSRSACIRCGSRRPHAALPPRTKKRRNSRPGGQALAGRGAGLWIGSSHATTSGRPGPRRSFADEGRGVKLVQMRWA